MAIPQRQCSPESERSSGEQPFVCSWHILLTGYLSLNHENLSLVMRYGYTETAMAGFQQRLIALKVLEIIGAIILRVKMERSYGAIV